MSLCQTDEKTKNGCMANGLVLLAPPTDWTAPTVALTAVPVETLGPPTPRFGQIALPLPVGALLAGGMHTAVGLPASATQTFDAAAQIVSAPFLPAANQASCAP